MADRNRQQHAQTAARFRPASPFLLEPVPRNPVANHYTQRHDPQTNLRISTEQDGSSLGVWTFSENVGKVKSPIGSFSRALTQSRQERKRGHHRGYSIQT